MQLGKKEKEKRANTFLSLLKLTDVSRLYDYGVRYANVTRIRAIVGSSSSNPL